jgi:serine/threonine protein kinase
MDPAAIPERIGPYRCLETLGDGGVAVVFRARHEATGALVAVKTPKRAKEAHLGSLRREIDALRGLGHPGVVRILDDGVVHGRPWYAMELLEGQTLAAFLPRRARTQETSASTLASPSGALLESADEQAPPPLPTPGLRQPLPANLGTLLTIFRRLCTPLGLIHGQGIVHGDLKPANVFVRPDGTPVLMDFGLAGRWGGASGRERLDATPVLGGTAAYMAPEQVRGERLDPRADLYALGCMIYEAASGRPPFVGDTAEQVLQHHLRADPPPLSKLVDDLPPGLEALVGVLLEKDADGRLGHADDVADRLAALGAEGWPGEPPLQPRPYLYRPRLAGREEVVNRLARDLYAAAADRGRVVVLVGEAGIGKSMVADEIARRGARQGFRVVAGEGSALGVGREGTWRRERVLHPFTRLLQVVADRVSEGGAAAHARLLGPRARVLAAVEPALLMLPGDPGPPLPELPPEAARRRMIEALGDTVAALANERPLLLVLEDLHFADEVSLAFVRAQAARGLDGKPLFILGTSRPPEPGSDVAKLLETPGVVGRPLGPLETPALERMVADMLAVRLPPEELLQVLGRRAGGHPFFATEYLRAALGEGLLRRDRGGRWRLEETPFDGRPLPADLDGLMARRLGRLDPVAAELCAVAAALGRETEGDLVIGVAARALGAPEPELSAATRALIADQILEESTRGHLRFVHDNLREQALRAVSGDRWRTLHGAAAEAIEALPAGAPLRSLARLAYHFTEAGATARALDYLEQAGAKAKETFALREAIEHYERAIALGPDVDRERRGRWKRALGDACLGLGRSSESYQHLCEAAALLGAPVPRGRLRMLGGLGGQVMRQIGYRLRPTPAAPPPDARVDEVARLYQSLGYVSYYVANRLDELLFATLLQLNMAERSASPDIRAIAYSGAQLVAGFVPLKRVAGGYGRLAEAVLGHAEDPAIASFVHLLLAVHEVGRARWQPGIEHCRQVIELGQSIGFAQRIEEGLGARATINLVRGALAEAEQDTRAALAVAERGSPHAQQAAFFNLASACLCGGRLDEAAAAAARGNQILASQELGRPEAIRALAVTAIIHLRRGDHVAARQSAETCARRMAEGAPMAFFNILSYGWTIEVFLELAAAAPDEDRAALLRAAREGLGHLKRCARVFAPAGAVYARTRGLLERELGRERAAHRWWRRGLGLARASEMPYQQKLLEGLLG